MITKIAMDINYDILNFNKSLSNITAFSTLRGRIDANDPYSGFNICNYTGDNTEHISECREVLCNSFGNEKMKIFMPKQSHSSNVAVIDSVFLEKSKDEQIQELNDIDAIITKLSNIIIGVNTADCLPIIMCDVKAKVIAVAHSGWRGTIDKIATRTFFKMLALGATAETTHVIIGASICKDCYEIGNEVLEKFHKSGFPIDNIATLNTETNKYHLDLFEANKWLLTESSNIPEANIKFINECTKCNPDKYFSARHLGIESGRIFTGIFRTEE
ncbi:MAG: peptidoglycan editing factor PgeF [Bacteroidales bacterium]